MGKVIEVNMLVIIFYFLITIISIFITTVTFLEARTDKEKRHSVELFYMFTVTAILVSLPILNLLSPK